MTRTLSALVLALSAGLAVSAQAMPLDVNMPHLTFPDTKTTPSTKGCETPDTASTCIREE